jgi:membrane protein implicated in regulation of membrane protease activity
MSKVFVGILLGTLLGFVGTFLVMLAIAGILDAIFGGPGYGALVFYLSFILSPIAAVVVGLVGARLAKRGSPSNRGSNPAEHAETASDQR